jgi:hypothetical protein
LTTGSYLFVLQVTDSSSLVVVSNAVTVTVNPARTIAGQQQYYGYVVYCVSYPVYDYFAGSAMLGTGTSATYNGPNIQLVPGGAIYTGATPTPAGYQAVTVKQDTVLSCYWTTVTSS